MSEVTLDQLLMPFAQSIFAKAEALNSLEPILTTSQRTRLMESISDDIKKSSNFIRADVSQAAFEEASRKNIELEKQNWHDQPRFDSGRQIFHFEHFIPVSVLRRECLAVHSVSEIISILRTQMKVVWILKLEDKELTRLGYRSRRDDPEKAYEDAKIIIRRSDSLIA